MQNTVKKNFDRFENFKTDTAQNFLLTKEDYKERIGDLDRMFGEQFEEMGNTIESVRIMARDSVNAKEKELTELMEKSVEKI